MTPKFKIGDVVEFETEVMYAKLYPSGHTEVMEWVSGYGIVSEIKIADTGVEYTITPEDALLDDIGDEVYVLEEEIIYIDLSKLVTEMTQLT